MKDQNRIAKKIFFCELFFFLLWAEMCLMNGITGFISSASRLYVLLRSLKRGHQIKSQHHRCCAMCLGFLAQISLNTDTEQWGSLHGAGGTTFAQECEGCWGPPEVWRDTTAFPGILTGTTSLVTARLGDFKPLLHGTVRTDFYYLPTLYLETKTVLFCEHFFFWFVCRSVCLCVYSGS